MVKQKQIKKETSGQIRGEGELRSNFFVVRDNPHLPDHYRGSASFAIYTDHIPRTQMRMGLIREFQGTGVTSLMIFIITLMGSCCSGPMNDLCGRENTLSLKEHWEKKIGTV